MIAFARAHAPRDYARHSACNITRSTIQWSNEPICYCRRVEASISRIFRKIVTTCSWTLQFSYWRNTYAGTCTYIVGLHSKARPQGTICVFLRTYHLSSRPDRVTGQVIGCSGARKATPPRFERSLNESSVTVASANCNVLSICFFRLLPDQVAMTASACSDSLCLQFFYPIVREICNLTNWV